MRILKFRIWMEDAQIFQYLDRIWNMPDPSYDGDVQQFTGLLDRQGKEIYEGDIVFDEDGEFSKTCKIIWDDKNATFVGIEVYEGRGFEMEEIDGEIIGNIYENKKQSNEI